MLLRAPDQEWALDFVSDALATGRALRGLTIVGRHTRECQAIEVGTGICSRTVTRTLERIIDERGKPQALCCDNGPELMRRRFLSWCDEPNIKLIHIQTWLCIFRGGWDGFVLDLPEAQPIRTHRIDSKRDWQEDRTSQDAMAYDPSPASSVSFRQGGVAKLKVLEALGSLLQVGESVAYCWITPSNTAGMYPLRAGEKRYGSASQPASIRMRFVAPKM